MSRWLLLFLILTPIFGLEFSIQSGKERGEPYSILHLRDTHSFDCNSYLDDFRQVIRIECSVHLDKKFPSVNNDQFNFSQTDNKLIITPKNKIALFPVNFDLVKDSSIYGVDSKSSRHWTVVGYIKNPPFMSRLAPSADAINFPIKIKSNHLPYVGGLDLYGNPLKVNTLQDVNEYMRLKKAYASGDYSRALALAASTLKKYPNSIFTNELMAYQIRSLHHLAKYEELIVVAKKFIRQYSNDLHIAEVLAYTGDAYSRVGGKSDSDYFYDRLFTHYKESPFASEGMFLIGKQLDESGYPNKSVPYYREALLQTKNVKLASASAFELARIEINKNNVKEAKEYIMKIVRGNPRYFTDIRPKTMAMIELLREKKEFLLAAKITQSLLDAASAKSLEHQAYLKSLGLLYAQGGEKTKALEKLNVYLKMYPKTEDTYEVQRAKDNLFFEKNDEGALGEKKYDELIERYGDDSVGQTALYKKGQLLFREKKYETVLKMENELYKLNSASYPEANLLVAKSATMITQEKLQKGKCSEALSLQKIYKITPATQWDGLNFECSLKEGHLSMAQGLLKKNSKHKEMASRQVWLYRTVKLCFAQGEYKKARIAGDDLVVLLESFKNPPLNDIVRVLFDTAQRSGDDMGMIRNIKKCETLFGVDFKDIERYGAMIAVGVKRKDEVMVQAYALKVMNLQKRTSTFTQSPFVEFTLAQSFMNQDKNKEALETLKILDSRKLSAEKRSRQKYLMGSLLMKMKRQGEAKTAFNASIKADKNSAWGKLAIDALGLL